MKPKKNVCHVETTIGVIGGKWKPWILWHLYDGAHRYGELRRLTPGITSKMLTQQLQELEHDGIIDRNEFEEKIARVEYCFTQYGKSLRPLLKQLCRWGDKHIKHKNLNKKLRS